MIYISYNYKSDFGPAWVSGDRRFSSADLFITWLREQLAKGPVLITSYIML